MIHVPETTMSKKCEVRNCTFNTERKYHFPKLVERCKKWIRACGNNNLLKIPHQKLREKVICDAHFEQRFKLSKRLSNIAIPTLYLPDFIDISIDDIPSLYNPEESQQKNIDLPVTATDVAKTLTEYFADLPVTNDLQFDANEIGQIEQIDTASINYSNIDTEKPNCSTPLVEQMGPITLQVTSDDLQFDANEIGQIEQIDTASINYSNIDTEKPNCSTPLVEQMGPITLQVTSDDLQFDAEIGQIEQIDTDGEKQNCSTLVPQCKLKRKLSTKNTIIAGKKKGNKRNRTDLYSQPWRYDLY
ncbi:uncharacterized protein LOC112467699 [Temnothorax curvispinosus]|uniref:Uncharacterized protein LOC112467699 n=1 Tax=Temnothorax curvispinosus TaxID=300111 RepID=A0A6J1RH98_9HYME|nr:uncharacterized protein LOC112467699 [Temnothorax curvispinosus]